MARTNLLKNIFVEKVTEAYGFSTTDARFLYEIMITSLIECFTRKNNFKIPRIGRIGFKIIGKNHRVRESYFKPTAELVYTASGREYQDYVELKRKAKNEAIIDKRRKDDNS